jgi:hypothetical protein
MAVDLDKLTAPFPKAAIKTRAGGGGRFSYVEGYTVIHRLNDATGNNWNMRILKFEKNEEIGVLMATVEIEIPGLGARQHVGMQEMGKNQGLDSVVKGAITDAMKKAATLFGVGLELYGPDYGAEESAQPARNPAPQKAPAPAQDQDQNNEYNRSRLWNAAVFEFTREAHRLGFDVSTQTAEGGKKVDREKVIDLACRVLGLADDAALTHEDLHSATPALEDYARRQRAEQPTLLPDEKPKTPASVGM